MVIRSSRGFSRREFTREPDRPLFSFISFSWRGLREKNAASHAEKNAENRRRMKRIRDLGNIESSKVSSQLPIKPAPVNFVSSCDYKHQGMISALGIFGQWSFFPRSVFRPEMIETRKLFEGLGFPIVI